jgi:VanZ family protein
MKTLLRIAAATVLAVLIALMVGPFGELEGRTGIWDKGAHFVAFGVILLCLGALFSRIPRLALAIGAVGVGGLVEVVQGLTGRDASLGDLLADALGAAVVFLIWAGWRHFGPRSARQTSNTR